MTETPWTQHTQTFPDGSVWTYESPCVLTYDGPTGPNRWEWRTQQEACAAWLAVCTH